MKKIVLAAALFLTTVGLSPVQALEYGFSRITTNGVTNPADQFIMDVTDTTTQALFVFKNTGPVASAVSRIYFDMTSPFPMTFASFHAPTTTPWVATDKTGVSFQQGANPNNLPSGNSIAFEADLRVSADNPAPQKGINPNEQLGILFNYLNNANFDTIIAQLNNGMLKVGLHVQSIGTAGQSESFVNKKPDNPPPPVPEPGTLLLLGSGLAGVAWYVRKRKQG